MLGSHELNGHSYFWPHPPKNHWNNFVMWICTSMQNISSFHLFIFEIQSISESRDQTGHAHFYPCLTKNYLINFQYMWTCISMQKIKLFHLFVLEIWLVKKLCNLTGREHFGPYPKIFPNMGFFQEHSK